MEEPRDGDHVFVMAPAKLRVSALVQETRVLMSDNNMGDLVEVLLVTAARP